MKKLSSPHLTQVSGGVMAEVIAGAAVGSLVSGIINSSFSIFNEWYKGDKNKNCPATPK